MLGASGSPVGEGRVGTRGSYWCEQPQRSGISRETGDSAQTWDLSSLTLNLLTPPQSKEGVWRGGWATWALTKPVSKVLTALESDQPCRFKRSAASRRLCT